MKRKPSTPSYRRNTAPPARSPRPHPCPLVHNSTALYRIDSLSFVLPIAMYARGRGLEDAPTAPAASSGIERARSKPAVKLAGGALAGFPETARGGGTASAPCYGRRHLLLLPAGPVRAGYR